MSAPIPHLPAGRKRHTLRQMADFAFDEAYKLRVHNSRMAEAGASGYPRGDDMKKVQTFEDICHFLDAIRDLKGPVKDEIRKQITETQQRKAAQDKLNSVEMHTEQDRK